MLRHFSNNVLRGVKNITGNKNFQSRYTIYNLQGKILYMWTGNSIFKLEKCPFLNFHHLQQLWLLRCNLKINERYHQARKLVFPPYQSPQKQREE